MKLLSGLLAAVIELAAKFAAFFFIWKASRDSAEKDALKATIEAEKTRHDIDNKISRIDSRTKRDRLRGDARK